MLPPSANPYLVRAVFDWCLAQGHTPYVLVSAVYPGVRVPEGHANNGCITLDINPRAADGLELGTERLRFRARFGGKMCAVEVPYGGVMAVFAAETHEGWVFGDPGAALAAASAQATTKKATTKKATIEEVTKVRPAPAAEALSPAPETSAKSPSPKAESDPPRLRLVE